MYNSALLQWQEGERSYYRPSDNGQRAALWGSHGSVSNQGCIVCVCCKHIINIATQSAQFSHLAPYTYIQYIYILKRSFVYYSMIILPIAVYELNIVIGCRTSDECKVGSCSSELPRAVTDAARSLLSHVVSSACNQLVHQSRATQPCSSHKTHRYTCTCVNVRVHPLITARV